jgi:uracil-DNA glycosylase
MSDAKIQLTSWPKLREKVKACANCAQAQFEELDGQHAALFSNPKGARIINDFIK